MSESTDSTTVSVPPVVLDGLPTLKQATLTRAPVSVPATVKKTAAPASLDILTRSGVSTKELEEFARQHKGGFFDVTITPASAKLLLKLNTENRPLREDRVAEFVAIIAEDRYQNTGEPIIVSDAGILNEGQHRLTAISRGTQSVKTDIRFGISRKAFVVTGTALRRTNGDVLSLHGVGQAMLVAAMLKLAMAYEEGLPTAFRWMVGSDKILAAHERWPDIEETNKFRQTIAFPTYLKNAATGVALWLAVRQCKSPDLVREFAEQVISHETGPRKPAGALRDKLFNDDRVRFGDRSAVVIKLALWITAWNAFRANELLTKLAWDYDKPFPKMPRVKL